MQKPVLDVAVQFQGDHEQHARLLSSTITKLGGTPAQPKSPAAYNFPVNTLKNQADVLRFAAGLEKGSASAYDQKVGDAAIPPGAEAFSSREILPGAIYRRMLSVPGAYRYFCIAHEGIGMLGRIVVLPR